jgi:hypothetical protein
MATFFTIDEEPAWADRMWDTYGFDYLKGSSPVLAWPLDVTTSELASALSADGVSFETFEADPERVFA